ncbi:MAG: hypothetical protein NHB15_06685 [Methanosarcina barkeri]|nr:hypothetical protein [Methanosarcina sp. ERenArc_MAG2]
MSLIPSCGYGAHKGDFEYVGCDFKSHALASPQIGGYPKLVQKRNVPWTGRKSFPGQAVKRSLDRP